MLKKLFKIFGILVLLALFGFGIAYYLYNEPLPTGESGPEADALAFRMLDALNYKNYQNTNIIEWSFNGGDHQYLWNKEKEQVDVSWGNYKVDLDLINKSSSKAYENGELLSYEKTKELIETASSHFNNDSFWLVAPFKIFDKGTQRFLVDLKDGSEGLLVTYTRGGDTPGDSYLWILEPSGIPKSYKMWVKIIPIGGLEATWDGWEKTESGTLLPSSHSFGPITLFMGDVKGY